MAQCRAAATSTLGAGDDAAELDGLVVAVAVVDDLVNVVDGGGALGEGEACGDAAVIGAGVGACY